MDNEQIARAAAALERERNAAFIEHVAAHSQSPVVAEELRTLAARLRAGAADRFHGSES